MSRNSVVCANASSSSNGLGSAEEDGELPFFCNMFNLKTVDGKWLRICIQIQPPGSDHIEFASFCIGRPNSIKMSPVSHIALSSSPCFFFTLLVSTQSGLMTTGPGKVPSGNRQRSECWEHTRTVGTVNFIKMHTEVSFQEFSFAWIVFFLENLAHFFSAKILLVVHHLQPPYFTYLYFMQHICIKTNSNNNNNFVADLQRQSINTVYWVQRYTIWYGQRHWLYHTLIIISKCHGCSHNECIMQPSCYCCQASFGFKTIEAYTDELVGSNWWNPLLLRQVGVIT